MKATTGFKTRPAGPVRGQPHPCSARNARVTGVGPAARAGLPRPRPPTEGFETSCRDFDNRFNRGENVLRQLDLARASRPGNEQRRVNVDFPVWMIDSLDKEAKRLGVTRQSIIKVWIAERLQKA
jgi:hypothetical protein